MLFLRNVQKHSTMCFKNNYFMIISLLILAQFLWKAQLQDIDYTKVWFYAFKHLVNLLSVKVQIPGNFEGSDSACIKYSISPKIFAEDKILRKFLS